MKKYEHLEVNDIYHPLRNTTDLTSTGNWDVNIGLSKFDEPELFIFPVYLHTDSEYSNIISLCMLRFMFTFG
jgi:hypothetical protein